MDKQKVIVYVDGFNFYYGLRKNRWRKYYWLDMVRLFEPFQRSSAIASMFTSVIRLERYESRFRNSLLPDTVTLRDGYELTIPEKWKAYQTM